MFAAFTIALREGVEIALILAIIFSYLKQLGQQDQNRKVWVGTGLAISICILIGIGIFLILGSTEVEDFQAVLEGSLKIIAVIVLTWMTLWMKKQGGNLSGALRNQIYIALNNGSVWTLTFLAFISVIREGIETVLFVVGITQESGIGAVGIGVVLGFGVAAIIGYFIYKGTNVFPLNTFFKVMSVLLIFVAAGLLAGAIGEFQEMHLIPTVIENVWNTKWLISEDSPVGGVIKAIFGYQESPNLVGITAYGAYLVVSLFAYFGVKTNRNKGTEV